MSDSGSDDSMRRRLREFSPATEDFEHERARAEVKQRLFGTDPHTANIGRFQVLGRVGAGGMGTVYACYDPLLDRKVAVKVLHGRGLTEEQQERSVREARAMARLSHSNVVGVHDVGTEAQHLYIAMEFVDGRTLWQWLQEERRSVAEILAVCLAAGEGLLAAHKAGLVHRDFKPDNVMIDRDGRVRVFDFGVARLLEERRHETEPDVAVPLQHEPEREMASATARVGTPLYMSPEQLRGETIGPQSDQFSFCVTVWQALHGQHPFEGDLSKTVPEAILAGDLRPVSAGQNTVPGRVERALLKGLAARPQDRHPSMGELLHELRHDSSRRRRWMGTAAAIALLVGTAAWAGSQTAGDERKSCEEIAVALDPMWTEPVRGRSRAAFSETKLPYAADAFERVDEALLAYQEQWLSAYQTACEATRSGVQSEDLMDLRIACLEGRRRHVEGLIRLFEGADATVVRSAPQVVSHLPGVNSCANREALLADVPPPEDPETVAKVEAADVRLADVLALRKVGKYDEALGAASALLEDVESIGYAPLHADVRQNVGFLQHRTGEYEAARKTLEGAFVQALSAEADDTAASAAIYLIYLQGVHLNDLDEADRWAALAMALMQRPGVGDPHLFAEVHYQRGVARSARGDYEAALEDHEKALGIKTREHGKDSAVVAMSLNAIASQYIALGQYGEARELLARALAIREEKLGPEHPFVASTAMNLGVALDAVGELEAAMPLFRRALAIEEKVYGRRSANAASTLFNIGKTELRRNRLKNALRHLEEALSIWEEIYGSDHVRVGAALLTLGNAQAELGQRQEADESYRRAGEIFRNKLGEEHPNTAAAMGSRALLWARQGRHAEAVALMRRAKGIFEVRLGPENPEVGSAYGSLGQLALLRGEPQSAIDPLEKALGILEKTLDGKKAPEVADTLAHLGQARLGLGDLQAARKALRRALRVYEAGGLAPEKTVEARFDLARAVVGEDPDEARALARQARADALAGEGDRQALVGQIEAWLQAR